MWRHNEMKLKWFVFLFRIQCKTHCIANWRTQSKSNNVSSMCWKDSIRTNTNMTIWKFTTAHFFRTLMSCTMTFTFICHIFYRSNQSSLHITIWKCFFFLRLLHSSSCSRWNINKIQDLHRIYRNQLNFFVSTSTSIHWITYHVNSILHLTQPPRPVSK